MLAPYVMVLVTPVLWLGLAMATFIAVGAVLSIATRATDAERYIPLAEAAGRQA